MTAADRILTLLSDGKARTRREVKSALQLEAMSDVLEVERLLGEGLLICVPLHRAGLVRGVQIASQENPT